jgi:hypothetical protein
MLLKQLLNTQSLDGEGVALKINHGRLIYLLKQYAAVLK